MMNEQKTRRKPNAVDIFILAIILLAAAFFVWRYVAGRPAEETAPDPGKLRPVTVTLSNFAVTNDTFEGAKIFTVGAVVVEKSTGAVIGKITDVRIEPSRVVTVDMNGQYVETSNPLASYVVLTLEGSGSNPEDGGLLIDDWHGYVNKDYEINIGDCAFYLRLSKVVFEPVGDTDNAG